MTTLFHNQGVFLCNDRKNTYTGRRRRRNPIEMKPNHVKSGGDEIALCFFVVGAAGEDSMEKQMIVVVVVVVFFFFFLFF